MKWKTVNIYPEFKGLYEISEFGDIRSLPRTIEVYHGIYGLYKRTLKGRTLATRTTKKSPHLFTDFSVTYTGLFGNKVKYQKTIYIHKLVGLMFLEKPNNKEKIYVEHIKDDYTNNHYSNLRWVTCSELQQRNINERYPENRNRLRDANIKSGYYKYRAGRNRNIEIDLSKLYYQLRGHRIYGNFGKKLAKIDAVPLKKVLEKFEDKLISFTHFKFQRLTVEERAGINNIIKNHYSKKSK